MASSLPEQLDQCYIQHMDSIDKVLTRGVHEILPSREGLTKLVAKKKIKLYLGIDPSNSNIHLGNAVALWKLRQFQDLGHKVILLIGDFTGMIGDPTDKTAARKKLTREEVLKNAKTYKDQASKILKFDGPNPAEIKFNNEWLGKLSSADWIELISNFTSQQLEERDMFVARKKEGKPVYMHEMVYPIMQGYDSVAMDVDLEVGGTDQTFNMLVGRHLMKTLKNKEKFVLTVPLLLGFDGQKMGKTTGNYIAIDTEPVDMFGKIMSIRDDLIKQYFELATNVDLESVDLSKPMDTKKRLATEVVKIYHGEEKARVARENFENVIQNKQTPISMTTIVSGSSIAQTMVDNNIVGSISEAKNLANQGGISISHDRQNFIPVPNPKITEENDYILKIGTASYYEVTKKKK